ncbi:MAG: hypothetical protein HYW49_02475 [Deltaproteobacteria bacterium]|nr:hypothetical protein [Deltaproteobacteria bacterium]
MKTWKSVTTIFAALLIAGAAHAAGTCKATPEELKPSPSRPLPKNAKRLLLCYNTEFADLKKIEVYETRREGQLALIETDCENKTKSEIITDEYFNRGSIYLSNFDWDGWDLTRQLELADRWSTNYRIIYHPWDDPCVIRSTDLTCEQN